MKAELQRNTHYLFLVVLCLTGQVCRATSCEEYLNLVASQRGKAEWDQGARAELDRIYEKHAYAKVPSEDIPTLQRYFDVELYGGLANRSDNSDYYKQRLNEFNDRNIQNAFSHLALLPAEVRDWVRNAGIRIGLVEWSIYEHPRFRKERDDHCPGICGRDGMAVEARNGPTLLHEMGHGWEFGFSNRGLPQPSGEMDFILAHVETRDAWKNDYFKTLGESFAESFRLYFQNAEENAGLRRDHPHIHAYFQNRFGPFKPRATMLPDAEQPDYVRPRGSIEADMREVVVTKGFSQDGAGGYTDTRGLVDIANHLSEVYVEDLFSLDSSSHIIDAGSGEAVAMREYRGEVQPALGLNDKLKFRKRFFQQPKHRRANVTAISKVVDPSVQSSPGLTILRDRWLEDIWPEEITSQYGPADIVQDFWGVIPYTVNPTKVLQTYHAVLKPGGRFYLRVGPRQVEEHRGEFRVKQRSSLWGFKVKTPRGQMPFVEWLQNLPGFREKFLDEENGTLCLEKTDEPFSAPVLTVVDRITRTLPADLIYEEQVTRLVSSDAPAQPPRRKKPTRADVPVGKGGVEEFLVSAGSGSLVYRIVPRSGQGESRLRKRYRDRDVLATDLESYRLLETIADEDGIGFEVPHASRVSGEVALDLPDVEGRTLLEIARDEGTPAGKLERLTAAYQRGTVDLAQALVRRYPDAVILRMPSGLDGASGFILRTPAGGLFSINAEKVVVEEDPTADEGFRLHLRHPM